MCLPVACGEQVETREIQRKISSQAAGPVSRYGATLSSNNLIGIIISSLRSCFVLDSEKLIVPIKRNERRSIVSISIYIYIYLDRVNLYREVKSRIA